MVTTKKMALTLIVICSAPIVLMGMKRPSDLALHIAAGRVRKVQLTTGEYPFAFMPGQFPRRWTGNSDINEGTSSISESDGLDSDYGYHDRNSSPSIYNYNPSDTTKGCHLVN